MESYLANREKELTAQNLEQKDSAEEISEEVPTSVQGQRFSDEVKDVLAALESLIVRATSISSLRKEEGRKLSEQATTALELFKKT